MSTERNPLERITWNGDTLDEVVVFGVDVHFEVTDAHNCYCVLTRPDTRATLMLRLRDLRIFEECPDGGGAWPEHSDGGQLLVCHQWRDPDRTTHYCDPEYPGPDAAGAHHCRCGARPPEHRGGPRDIAQLRGQLGTGRRITVGDMHDLLDEVERLRRERES